MLMSYGKAYCIYRYNIYIYIYIYIFTMDREAIRYLIQTNMYLVWNCLMSDCYFSKMLNGSGIYNQVYIVIVWRQPQSSPSYPRYFSLWQVLSIQFFVPSITNDAEHQYHLCKHSFLQYHYSSPHTHTMNPTPMLSTFWPGPSHGVETETKHGEVFGASKIHTLSHYLSLV